MPLRSSVRPLAPAAVAVALVVAVGVAVAVPGAGAAQADGSDAIPPRWVPVTARAPVPADGERHPLSILGPSRLDAAQLVAGYLAAGRTPRIDGSLVDLARLYLEEGEALGVRGDLAWAQTMVETGWLSFPGHGQVRVEDHNYAGIGAYDGGARGFGYPDARTGVRAQLQLLRQYADPAPLDEPLVRAPASKRGAVPTWLHMGNGNWATAPHYAEAVLRVYTAMLRVAGASLLPDPSSPPAAAGVPSAAPPPAADPSPSRPAERAPARLGPGDGLWLVTADGHVHARGVARFWGSLGARNLSTEAVALAPNRAGDGYWLLVADGRVGAFGDAIPWGPRRRVAGAPAVGLVSHPHGSGYWIAHRDGRVRAFGEAPPLAVPPDALDAADPVVALAAHPDGRGLWLASRSGRVVALGSAAHHGDASTARAVVDVRPTPTGAGYWLLDGGGRVHAFGDATPMPGLPADGSTPAVALVPVPGGTGAWISSADGTVTPVGGAPVLRGLRAPGAPVRAAVGVVRATAGGGS